MGKYSSKKLRTGLKQHTAAGKTASDVEEGGAGNGPSPVGPLEGNPARNTANLQANVNGGSHDDVTTGRDVGELQGHNLELDSSMGNGPVSHRSLASNGSAAAVVSHKNLGANQLSAKSFGSSGRVWGTPSNLSKVLAVTLMLFAVVLTWDKSAMPFGM